MKMFSLQKEGIRLDLWILNPSSTPVTYWVIPVLQMSNEFSFPNFKTFFLRMIPRPLLPLATNKHQQTKEHMNKHLCNIHGTKFEIVNHVISPPYLFQILEFILHSYNIVMFYAGKCFQPKRELNMSVFYGILLQLW